MSTPYSRDGRNTKKGHRANWRGGSVTLPLIPENQAQYAGRPPARYQEGAAAGAPVDPMAPDFGFTPEYSNPYVPSHVRTVSMQSEGGHRRDNSTASELYYLQDPPSPDADASTEIRADGLLQAHDQPPMPPGSYASQEVASASGSDPQRSQPGPSTIETDNERIEIPHPRSHFMGYQGISPHRQGRHGPAGMPHSHSHSPPVFLGTPGPIQIQSRQPDPVPGPSSSTELIHTVAPTNRAGSSSRRDPREAFYGHTQRSPSLYYSNLDYGRGWGEASGLSDAEERDNDDDNDNDSMLMSIPGDDYDGDVSAEWSNHDQQELRRLLEQAERFKWKYIGEQLSMKQDKRIPAIACQRKFRELFGVAEASSKLKSSLFYVAYRSGWKSIKDQTTQMEVSGEGNVSMEVKEEPTLHDSS